MTQMLLIVHLLLALALIGVVLLQRSEGGGLGIGGGGGMGGFMTGRSTANFLTRVTAVLAGLFMISSLAMTIFVNDRGGSGGSLTDQLRQGFEGAPGITQPSGDQPAGEGTAPAPSDEGGQQAPKVE